MMAIPLTVGVMSNLSALAMHALAERLLTLVLAAFIIGGVGVFALSGFAWLWMKRAVGALPAWPTAAPH